MRTTTRTETCHTWRAAQVEPPRTRRKPPRFTVVRYGTKAKVIGVTIISARYILERTGHIAITLPPKTRVDEDVFAPVLG